MIFITAGRKYIDIDAYASMLAYRELLRSQGEDAYATSSAQFNQSVPPLIQDLKYHLDDRAPQDGAKYILVDVSNPDFFDENVKNGDIIEVIDHHTGFENYWTAETHNQNVKTQIEFIGSVCTMIFEKILASGETAILDTDLCKLLLAGILDNTLNLRSSITTDRDLQAYEQLKAYGHVSDRWRQEYFNACDAEILKNPPAAILNDLKIERVSPLLPEAVGQLVLLDTSKIDYQTIADALSNHAAWLMNLIDLNTGRSYLYFNGDGVKTNLEKLFNRPCTDNHLMILDHFLLRKQIMKLAREHPEK